MNTLVLTEESGKTTVNLTVRYESKEARDAVLASPMEKGVAESFDALEEILPILSLETRVISAVRCKVAVLRPDGVGLPNVDATVFAAPFDLQNLELVGRAVPVLEDVWWARGGHARVLAICLRE